MKKNKLILALGQIAILVVTAGGFVYLQKTQVAPTEAYTFSRDISANTQIQEGDLIKVSVPKDGIKSNFVTNKEDIIGKSTTTDVYKEQYVITNQLVDSEDVDIFEQMDLSNYRKITIAVNTTTAVGGNIAKGDTVDLQFTAKAPNSQNGEEATYTKTFMQDVLVYNVIDDGGYQYIDKSEGNSTQVDSDGNVIESGTLTTVTLCVTPEQADEIQTRVNAGTISLVGRFSESVDGASNGFTLGGYDKIATSNSTPEN